jgi:hypothetical protein
MTGLVAILASCVGAFLLGAGFWIGFRVGGAKVDASAQTLPSGLLPKPAATGRITAKSEVELAEAEAEEYDRPLNDPGKEFPTYD